LTRLPDTLADYSIARANKSRAGQATLPRW